jgi:hypothetical protein
MMPAHFGARYHGPGSSGWYRDVTALTVPEVEHNKRRNCRDNPRSLENS